MTCVNMWEKRRHDEGHEPKPNETSSDEYDNERNTISVCECE